MTSNSQRDNNTSSNARRKPRNNGPDRTKNRADPLRVHQSPLHPLEQRTNHDLSHNSIECYNCGKLGHIKPNCPEPIRACHIEAIHVEDLPTEQVNNTNLYINDPIDDEHPDEDKYCNKDYNNQLDLSEDQRSWGSKPSEFNWSDDNQPR
ncbi:hypothetical protein M422DRAFT_267227 [Sphaerobolus stellatus SS14]|uniref:CCHC-type domain-containing protein n=1 Tax=Sphaerobolus stellatus (strain SS14) TaxID=990650 RepID=A0A0C9UQ30_SPHS4|nr:hypothetical protein M422DRAFT_267227 [Sphaerobolus stellatus SS14]